MSYAKDREEFIARMTHMGLSIELIRSILRDAGIIQRAAEVECSVSDETIRAASERAAKLAGVRILYAWRSVFKGGSVKTYGDPRGACVKLRRSADDKGDSWGQDGWCVPAQGYRASQMARMTR